MDVDDSIESTIANCFSHYKNSVFKIGLEEAHAQYATLYQDLNEHRWKLELLREFYYIQFTVAKCRNQDQAGRQIRNGVNLLTNNEWIHEHATHIVSMLDWFDNLEQEDRFNQRQGTLQDVVEGFVYLTTRCELIKCVIQNDPISVPEMLNRLLLSAGRLISKRQLHISEMLYTVIEEDPQYATWIRYQLLERELLPELIVRITVTFCTDEIVFLNGVFCDLPSWFMVQSANSISHFMKVKGRIFGEIERSMIEDDTVQLAMAIRALAGLVGYLGIKLNDVEIV
ncbi:hypothetical protein BDA99DRAFT_328608 [Phascolomyces articulosus]|uniref:Uncharacterized protein n=1 Tax=Phascolomyces articulosus TaxID=60185 RepID=A0AAD5K5Y5_9FUNG|nr:hypothetical protein BDA99DRAFT_328608 [Phascolomyces articulosus]